MSKIIKTDNGIKIIPDENNPKEKVILVRKYGLKKKLDNMTKSELLNFAKTCAKALEIEV